MAYIYAVIAFIVRMAAIFIFDKFLTPLSRNNKVISQLLDEELLKHDQQKEGENVPFRLRAINYFMNEKDLVRLEGVRTEMNDIVAKNNGKPGLLLTLFISKAVINWLCFIVLLVLTFNSSEPSTYMTVILFAITLALWILIKRYIFIVISIVAVIFVYRFLPAATVFYLSLVMTVELLKFFIRKRQLKNVQPDY